MPIYNPIEYVFNSLKMYDPALPVRLAKHLRCKFYYLYINNNMHRRCLAKRAGEAGRQHTFNNINQLDELLIKFKANTNIKGVNNLLI